MFLYLHNKISRIWDKYGLMLLVSISILILIIATIISIGKKGSWDDKPIKYISNGGFQSPKKGESKGELESRRVIEKIFNKPFPKARPDFLKNEVNGGHNLELDCYNPELRLAVEYQGRQHYEYIPHFHKNYEAFLNQKYRDDMKRRMCTERGITIIELPHPIKLGDISSFLAEKCLLYYNSIK